MKRIVLLGGGGLALEIAEYMKAENIIPLGYCSPNKEKQMNSVLEWLGDEKDVHCNDFNYVIASGNMQIRKAMIAFLIKKEANVYSFISQRSQVSKLVKIGKGAVVLPFSSISGNAVIGDFLLLNTFASIHHDVEIGANAVLSPGARIPGFCKIADNFFMGLNASLVPGTKIGENVDVSINAYIGKKVSSNMTVIAKTGVVFAK